MNKRSTKFYRKNEAEVMRRLGFRSTKNSGAGWIEKEDGQSEHCICQLKSTDKQSISIKQHDLRVLEYNASVAHKLPVFALQFLNTDEVWLMIRPEDLGALQGLVRGEDISEHLNKSSIEDEFCLDTESEEEYNVYVPGRNAGKSFLARQRYNEQKQKEADERKEKMKQKDRERRRQFAKKVKTKGNRTL